MTQELQSTLVAVGRRWLGRKTHISCRANIILLAMGVFMNSLGVNGCTKSWEADKHDPQVGENESTDIGKSQRLPKQNNAIINKVLAMQLDLAKIIEIARIARHFERPETTNHIADNACGVDYADT
jgi:hypothetical protein